MASSSSSSSLTVGAPQPWPPSPSSSKTFKNDFCSLGICSFNCPQFCLGFPPPPPLFLNSGGDDDGSSSSSRISPLIAVLIAVLASAFLLLFYFTVISKLCRRSRRRRRNHNSPFLDPDNSDSLGRVDSLVHDPTRPEAAEGLDDAFIRQITVFKYRKEDKLIDGSECAICLNEFIEEENLRLMPNCEHAFHIPCIDTWLKTHSNCPLCRSTMNLGPPVRSSSASGPGPGPNTGGLNSSVAALRVERSGDSVLVISEVESRVQVVEEDGDVGGGCGNLEERERKLDNNNNISNNNNNLR